MKLKHLTLAVAAAFATFAQASHARTPTETLYRPLMRGPIMTKSASAANQWAGRTTLASGSTSQVVSTSNINSDSLLSFTTEANIAATYASLGRTAVASGLAVATASTPAVYSGDIITAMWDSPNDITSGQALRINSIVNGKSFALTTANGLTVQASGAVAMWRIHGKDPQGLMVNTISPGTHFVFAWADGKARPFNTTVMWEIRRAS